MYIFQVFLSNTNNSYTIIWLQVLLSNTNNLYTIYGFIYSYLVLLINTLSYGFNYSYLILIVYIPIYSFKYPYLILIIYTGLYDFNYDNKLKGGARGVIVIVAGNGHGDTSSNPGRD